VKLLARLTLAGVLLAAAVPARAGGVKVSFSNGQVTIVATDASPRQILAEWARLGQVRITNLDRLAGGPMTLQLTDVPEAQALETLLRGTAGFVAAPRAEPVAASSRYDRILLLPGVAPTLPAIVAAPPSATTNNFGRGRSAVLRTFDAADENEPEPARPMPGMPPSGMSRDTGQPAFGRQPTPGQATMPGMMIQTPMGFPGMPTTPSPNAVPQSSASQAGYDYSAAGQRPSPGATVPGMATAPPPLPTTPYSNSGPPGLPTQVNTSAEVPGQWVTQPGQTAPAPTSASRPGEVTGPSPAAFRNPYGLPEPIQPPVVNPNANPYGLPNPVKTTPTVPIKKSGGNGGQ